MSDPQFISYDAGFHNADLEKTINRLKKSASYKDTSVVVIVPALENIPTRIVASWLSLYYPPNQKVFRLFAEGQEVGQAYTDAITSILAHPELNKYKYVLTMEHDNAPNPDGLVKLIEAMEAYPEFACIGGLYFTKGIGGVPQIWGDAKDTLNFRPQLPIPNIPNSSLVECCGTGMGFNLWRLEMFKDTRLKQPWFKTTANMNDGAMTQDLYFWKEARKYGYRCAIDVANRVGHYDYNGSFGEKGKMW